MNYTQQKPQSVIKENADFHFKTRKHQVQKPAGSQISLFLLGQILVFM